MQVGGALTQDSVLGFNLLELGRPRLGLVAIEALTEARQVTQVVHALAEVGELALERR